MRSFLIVTTFVLANAFSTFPASSQETVKDLAAKASAEFRLLNAFQTLERMTSQMNHFLIYAIQAERGGWDVVEFSGTTDYGSTNPYMILSTAEDVQIEIARASNTISKSKVATDDELSSAESAVESINSLLSLAPQIADMVEAGQLDEAVLLYHETGQPAYEAAKRSTQSGVGTTQKRLAKTLLGIRIAK